MEIRILGNVEKMTDNNADQVDWLISPDEFREWAKAARLARWTMIFAALSVVVGTVFGLTQNRSNKPPGSATHSEASTGPSITPLQQTEAREHGQADGQKRAFHFGKRALASPETQENAF
jgi:hypothetical protein